MLSEWIKEQITLHGPVTISQFMEWALYHPTWGYYTRGPLIGPRGDFTTSPEASPAFGAILARHIAEVDSILDHPPTFHILECGPGLGTLAQDILSTLKSDFPDTYKRVSYIMLEISEALRATQQTRLSREHQDKVLWLTDLSALNEPISGAVIANEFLDAFPVHVARGSADSLSEEVVIVNANGDLMLSESPPSTPEISEFMQFYGLSLSEGEKVEICLPAADWMGTLGQKLARGVGIFIDYGDVQPARYSPSRREGTLLGYRGGSVTDNLLDYPGEQDLTALVDFTHMSDAARRAGFSVLGITRQAAFLIGLGLGEGEASPLAQKSVESALDYRKGLQTLISMEGLGRFHILVISKEINADQAEPRLSGLRFSGIL